jgi:flagellar basal body-associated protein FliL
MMPNMMFGMDTYMLFWIVLVTVVCLLLIGASIWFAVNWLNKQKTPTTHYTPQPRDAYEEYEQGYQPQQQPPEIYQESGQHYSYPQNEQGQSQHQEMEQFQH